MDTLQLTRKEQIATFVIGEINKIQKAYFTLAKLVVSGDENVTAAEIKEALGEERFAAVKGFLNIKDNIPNAPKPTEGKAPRVVKTKGKQ